MELKPLSPIELALRQSLEIINGTIQDLCKRRDLLASQLPSAPKQGPRTHFMGELIGSKRPPRKAKVYPQ